jgi:hypothetical protein
MRAFGKKGLLRNGNPLSAARISESGNPEMSSAFVAGALGEFDSVHPRAELYIRQQNIDIAVAVEYLKCFP